jgi:hypothetical protein
MGKKAEGTWTHERKTPGGTHDLVIDPNKEPGANVVGEGGQQRIKLTGEALERALERAREDDG